MQRVLAAVLFGSLGLAACSGGSMNKAECGTADWRAVGFEDGAKGYRADAFARHRKSCAAHGVAADFDRYQAGHAEGLLGYCRPHNGYNLGLKGRRYLGICPAHLDGAFTQAHADGFGLYQRRMAVRNIGRKLSRSKGRSKKIEHLVAEKTAELVKPKVPPKRRANLAVEIKQLSEERIDIEHLIRELERDYDAAEHDYETYRQSLAGRY